MDAQGPLPPGWDMKFDKRTGRYYFINHYTKTTSWEDPREKYQQIGKPTAKDNKENQKPIKEESEKQEHRGGRASSPGTTASSHRRAASPGPPPTNRWSGSPAGAGGMTSSISGLPTSQPSGLPSYPSYYGAMSSGSPIIQSRMPMASPQPLARLQLEEAGLYDSPLFSQRSTLRRDSQFLAEIAEMENTIQSSEQAISRIAGLFPTVEEHEIRDLFKKYHGSQAVVISALQVAKHPLNTPGPASVFTPPPSRHATLPGVSQAILSGITMTGSLPYNFQQNMTPVMGVRDINGFDPSSGYPTPRPGTAASDLDTSLCMGSPQTSAYFLRTIPKPHSSPKMKLRYLKSVFPTVEEYLLLDVLANSENNVQKASDRLVKMGYVKRDAPSAPRLHAKKKAEERLAEKRTPLIKPPPIKTEAEKDALRNKMKDKYEKKFDIPERILFMALESVLYDEEQANNLITTMIEDDLKRQKEKESKQKEKETERARERAEKKKSPKPVRKADANLTKSPKREPFQGQGGKRDSTGTGKDDTDSKTSPDSSIQDSIAQHFKVSTLAKGPNPDLCKGPNDDLLLTDYVVWNGPNASLRKGPNSKLAGGPNPSLRKGPMCASHGPNPALRKGPQVKTKGSMIQNYENKPRRSA